MALWDNLKNAMRPYDDDEYMDGEPEEEVAPAPAPAAAPAAEPEEEYVEPKHKAPLFARREKAPAFEQPKSALKIVNPTDFGEAVEITDLLKGGNTVLVNIEGAEHDTARRLVDFLSGAVYALGGKIKPVSKKSLVLTPANVSLDEGIAGFESEERYF